MIRGVRVTVGAVLDLVVFAGGLGLASLSALGGCMVSGVCTEVGCSDQFHVAMTGADGSIPPGIHVLTVTVDDSPVTCVFQVPLPAGQSLPNCPGLWAVNVSPATTCTETSTSTAKSLTCTPIPGQFFEEFTIMGKPAQVSVTLTVDDTVILSRTETPTYQKTQPNGPQCEPTCQQASVNWTFSAT